MPIVRKSQPEEFVAGVGLAHSWDFLCKLSKLINKELVLFEFEGSQLVLVKDGPIWVPPYELFYHYFVPYNGVSCNLQRFARELGEPLIISDIHPSYSFGLTTQCAYSAQMAYFNLPSTLEKYIESLSKDHRYNFRKCNEQFVRMTMGKGMPGYYGHLVDTYKQRLMSQFHITEAEALLRIKVLWLFIEESHKADTSYIISVFDGMRCVGMNVAELIDGILFDYCSLWLPEYSGMGKYLINKNIESAINDGIREYDLGTVSLEGPTDYNYKLGYIPKNAFMYGALNFAMISIEAKHYYEMKEGYTIFPPYFDMEGNLKEA